MKKIKLDKYTREMMIQASISDYEDSHNAIESVLRKGFIGLENKSDTGLFYDEIQSMGYETVEDFEERYEHEIEELKEKIKMDLTNFSKHYKIVTQEPVDILYDVELDESKDLEVESIHDVIERYTERDDRVTRNEEINYFIYDLNDHEVFNTTIENELIMKMKELMNELEDKDLSQYKDQYKGRGK